MDESIHLHLRPSVQTIAWISASYALAAISIWLLRLPGWLTLIMELPLLIGWVRELRQHLPRSRHHAMLRFQKPIWQLEKGQHRRSGRLVRHHRCAGLLMLCLNLGSRRHCYVVLGNDSTDRISRQRLCRLLILQDPESGAIDRLSSNRPGQ